MRAPRPLLIVVAILLLAFIGFAVYWWIAVDRLRAGIVETREQLAAFGIAVEHGEPEIGGFPISLTLALPNPVVTLPDGTRIVGPEVLEGRVRLWNLESVSLEGPGRYELYLPQGDLVFESEDAVMTLELEGGLVDALSLRLVSAAITNRATAQTLAAEKLSLSLERILPRPGGQDTAFALQLEGLPLPAGATETAAVMGERIALLALAGRFEGPLFPGGEPRQIAAQWRDAGGILDLERIALAWGRLGISGAGTLTLDESFRPLGAFSLRTLGLPALVAKLGESGVLDAETAATLAAALEARSEGTDDSGRTVVTLPMTAQDGVLTLGEVEVGPLRPLF